MSDKLENNDDDGFEEFRNTSRKSAIIAVDELKKNLSILYKLIPSLTESNTSILSEKCAEIFINGMINDVQQIQKYLANGAD
jgi:hypothetical protein